jgi:AraC family transcriptional regulator of arabinose operon
MTDVINSRIEHAKYLLTTTDISVKQIAQLCGYNNENHFMRQFKEITGITPTKFRDNAKTTP